jgi:hypothetical protein
MDAAEMKTILPPDLKSSFANRGVSLNNPARESSITELRVVLGREVDSYLLGIYLEFDGFVGLDFDEGSFFRIWSIDEILDNIITTEIPRLNFCDIDLLAIAYSADFSDSYAPVISTYSGNILAPDVFSLFEMILSDKFFPVG